ncbi:MAG TPA: type II secretion system F family protein [bacterium]|nr:type II secretion system F family protein [bacterium]HOL47007.1 type II secretion system F family protein [bacterium]HPQ18997.1 type II secretion system F family protein [bacterium]
MIFKYIAYNSRGKIIKNKIEAENIEDVKKYLLNNQFIPIEIFESYDIKKVIDFSLFSSKTKILINFFSQLLFYLKSGFTIDYVLANIKKNFKDIKFLNIINKIYENIKKGMSFSEAIYNADKNNYFNNFIVNIIKSGEISGTLTNSISTIVFYLKRNNKIVSKINSALIYPLFVLNISLIVLLLLFLFVIPSVANLFSKINIELPLITRIIIFISKFLLKFFPVILILLVLSIIIFFRYIKKSTFYYKAISYLKLNLPFVKKIYLNNIIIQFANSMAIMLNNGVDLISSLKISKEILNNYYYDYSLNEVINKLKEGEKLNILFNKYSLFEDAFNSAIATGENSGQLTETLKEISEIYEEELNEQLEKFISIIEPMLILLLGLIVGTMVFSIMLPIFKISNVLRGGL